MPKLGDKTPLAYSDISSGQLPFADMSNGKEYEEITFDELRKLMLNVEEPDPDTGDKETNSPKGHIISIDSVTPNQDKADRDAQMATVLGYDNPYVAINRRYLWSEIETSEGVYDFSEVKKDIAACADAGKRMTVMINWRSFNSIESIPLYIRNNDPANVDYLYGGNCGNMSRVYMMDKFRAIYTAAKSELDGIQGFMGFLTQETALLASGYNVADFVANLEDLWTQICTDFPNYYHFLLMNHLTGVQTEQLYTAVEGTVNALGQDNNFVMCSPDVFPYAQGTSLTNSTQERIYSVRRKVIENLPVTSHANWMQYDSHKVNPDADPAEEKWGKCWPVSEDAPGNVWPVRDLFNFERMHSQIEWMFWNYTTSGTQQTDPEDLAVMQQYPSWDRAESVIPYADTKKHLAAEWTTTNGTMVETTSNVDAEHTKRVGRSSYRWNEGTATGVHKHQYDDIPASEFESGQEYTIVAQVARLSSAASDRRIRIEYRDTQGFTKGGTFNPSDGSWANLSAYGARDNKDYSPIVNDGRQEFWQIELDTIPNPAGTPTVDFIARLKLSESTNHTSYTGDGSDVFDVGRVTIIKEQ